jgi:hypothetical protein
MLGSCEARYKLPKPRLDKLSTAGMMLLMPPLLLLEVDVVFALVIKKEKWNEGAFSGWS